MAYLEIQCDVQSGFLGGGGNVGFLTELTVDGQAFPADLQASVPGATGKKVVAVLGAVSWSGAWKPLSFVGYLSEANTGKSQLMVDSTLSSLEVKFSFVVYENSGKRIYADKQPGLIATEGAGPMWNLDLSPSFEVLNPVNHEFEISIMAGKSGWSGIRVIPSRPSTKNRPKLNT